MIYAGLDIDLVAKLFTVQNDRPVLVRHADWLKILDGMGAEPGEMLLVSFRREAPPNHRPPAHEMGQKGDPR